MTWLYCANYGTSLHNSGKYLGPMTRRSCTLHTVAHSQTNYAAPTAVEAISSQQHHMGFNASCFFSTDTLLSVSHYLSLLSLLVFLCVFVVKPFVCFHFIVNSVPLNLSVLQSGPIQVHCTLYQHLFLSVASGMGYLEGWWGSIPRLNVSRVSPHTTHTRRNIHASLPMHNSQTSSYCREIWVHISRLPFSCTMTLGAFNFPFIISVLE